VQRSSIWADPVCFRVIDDTVAGSRRIASLAPTLKSATLLRGYFTVVASIVKYSTVTSLFYPPHMAGRPRRGRKIYNESRPGSTGVRPHRRREPARATGNRGAGPVTGERVVPSPWPKRKGVPTGWRPAATGAVCTIRPAGSPRRYRGHRTARRASLRRRQPGAAWVLAWRTTNRRQTGTVACCRMHATGRRRRRGMRGRPPRPLGHRNR
jgi:hypothetical protein